MGPNQLGSRDLFPLPPFDILTITHISSKKEKRKSQATNLALCPSYRNVLRYLPIFSRWVRWMFATAGISVGRFYRMGEGRRVEGGPFYRIPTQLYKSRDGSLQEKWDKADTGMGYGRYHGTLDPPKSLPVTATADFKGEGGKGMGKHLIHQNHCQ